MVQSLPSYNPSDTSSIEGGLNIYKDYMLKLIEHSIPCVVQSYDISSNTVTVLPAINIPLTTGEFMKRSPIKVTAWKLHGGGFQIHYPIKKGDTGWLVASDYDTSLFKQEKKVSDPNTYQKHKYQFGYYLPDKMNGFSVSSDDKDRLVFQNDEGTEKISLGSSDTKIVSANLSITSPNVNITGNVTIDGDIHATNYDVHVHSGVTSGGSNTGAPV